uniref:WAP domain-containing protein n=1 Tax=Globodera pallida TaxID=36090 RepID=A0A183BMY2_GLOPA
MPAGESNRQQQQAGSQHGFGTYSYGGPAPIHSACHPICHKSCTSSCVASRTTDQNNFNGFPQPAPPLNELQHPQQHNQPSTMVENNQASNNNNNCFPSQCRANCLRACARIFEGQQQQQNRESFVSTNGIDNNNVDPHYQVETGQNKQNPDYGSSNMMSGRNGGANNGCQCSPASVCECQETCYPVCIDTCESNCLQQQSQQTPASQRARCAQFCHLECQHDCAVEQQQQQQQRVPTRKAVDAMETSCARGIQFDAAGLTQQMAVPMPTMALDRVGPAQQLQNRSNNNGGEFEQHHQQMNDWEIGDSAQMLPNFGQNDGPNMAAIGNDDTPPSTTTAATIIPQAMEGVRQEQAVPPTTEMKPCAPLCQPECRPECNKRYMEERPDMERSQQQQQQQQYGQMVMSNNGIISRGENVGKSGGAASGVGGELMRLDQQNQNDQQQPPPPKQQRSAPQSSFFPPHIILDEGLLTAAAVAPPANDDESNVTTNGPPATNNDDNKKKPSDKMSWLRPQNETGGWDRNGGAMPPYQQNLTKLGGAREKQQQQQIIKDQQQEQQRQKVPNVKGGGKQRVVHHRHHNRLTKDGKIGRPASDFFRRRRILFNGGEPKVPKMAKKVPKNRPEAKIEPLKEEKKKEKSGDIGTKQQKANDKKMALK